MGRLWGRPRRGAPTTTESDEAMTVRPGTLDPGLASAARSASFAALQAAQAGRADVASVVGRAHDLNRRNGFAEMLERSMRPT